MMVGSYKVNDGFQLTLSEKGFGWDIDCFYIEEESDKVMAVTDEWDDVECNAYETEFHNPDYLTIEKVVEVTLSQLLSKAEQ